MSMAVVKFTGLQHGNKEDFILMAKEYKILCSPEKMGKRALEMLMSQIGVFGGAKIDLFQHGLQTATRAYQNGEDEEMVVCCLLHDIGEMLSPSNHGEIAAAILKPYISEKSYWILANHEVFQGYYYYDYVGSDKNRRDIFIGNAFYQDTVDFCEKYDAPSFDPDFKSYELKFFQPMVHKIFCRVPYFNDPTNPKSVAVLGMADDNSGMYRPVFLVARL